MKIFKGSDSYWKLFSAFINFERLIKMKVETVPDEPKPNLF